MFTREEYGRLAVQARVDPQPLIEHAFKIIPKGLPGQPSIMPLCFNCTQQRLHDVILRMRAEGRPPRVIVLKPRQTGVSTQCAGYLCATTMTVPYSSNMLVAHQDEITKRLFRKIQFMYEKLPDELPLTFATSRLNEMVVDSLRCEDGHFPLHSQVSVATASGGEIWRGQTLTSVLLSELAYYPNPDDTLLGVMQAVPQVPQSLVVIESTANGMGDVFHDEWLRATAGESDFEPVFIAWFEVQENRMPILAGFELEPDEQEMKREFGLEDEQLQWRRYTIHNQCRGRVELFDQEHPATDAMAFLMSGIPAFPRDVLQEMHARAMAADSPETGEMTGTGQFRAMRRGRLRVYEPPQPGHEYVIGADIAKGAEGGDYSVADVFNRTTSEQVAVWHGHLNPFVFGRLLASLGTWYNQAILSPELSGGWGFSTIEELKNLQYPRLYQYQRVDKLKGGFTNFLGWETNVRTKPLMMDSLDYLLAERTILLRDPDTIRECLAYQRNGNQGEGVGMHDDRVIAVMISIRTHLEMPMESTGVPPRVQFDLEPAREERVIANESSRLLDRRVWEAVEQEAAAGVQRGSLWAEFDGLYGDAGDGDNFEIPG